MKRAPLVGRDRERTGLDAALASCREGTGGLVLIGGEAGVAKSRLVGEVLAGWDGNVLRSAATVGDGAYAPVTQVLRGVSDRFGDDALADHARVLLPELAVRWRGIDREDLVAALHRTLRDVARRRPTVVVLEDLHWASPATLDLVPALIETIEHESLLFLGTYRSDELPRGHPLRAMRAELRRRGLLTELTLGPLSVAETGELLAGLLGAMPSADLVAAVHGRAEGLPFFVEELSAALADTDGVVSRQGPVELTRGAEVPQPTGHWCTAAPRRSRAWASRWTGGSDVSPPETWPRWGSYGASGRCSRDSPPARPTARSPPTCTSAPAPSTCT